MPAFLLLRDRRDAVLSRAALELLRSSGKPIKLLGCLTVVVGSLLPELQFQLIHLSHRTEELATDYGNEFSM
ncbi:hypothetical protein EJB05_27697, partial [Eragrostis curvula]